MPRRHIPGLALAVLDGSGVRFARGYGTSSLGHEAAVDEGTIFELGSVTKPLTTVAVLALVRADSLSLDDSLTSLLPGSPPAWASIRLRNLLNHTSGIPSHTDFPEILADESRAYLPAQMMAMAASRKLEFPAGTQWHYSDTNYFLLGLILQRLTGKPYGVLMHDRVFVPAGMTTAAQISTDSVPSRLASGYVFEAGRLRRGRPVHPSQSLGGGSLIASLRDLEAFDAALRGATLLPAEAESLAWSPTRLADGSLAQTFLGASYGLGWFVGEWQGHPFIEHTGFISSGFTTHILRLLDVGVTVIVLTNSFNPDIMADDAPRLWEMSRHVASLFLQSEGH